MLFDKVRQKKDKATNNDRVLHYHHHSKMQCTTKTSCTDTISCIEKTSCTETKIKNYRINVYLKTFCVSFYLKKKV